MSFDLVSACKLFTASIFGDPEKKHTSIDVQLTPELAHQIVTKYNYANQRPFSKKHASILAAAMSEDKFREFTPIDFAVMDDVPHLINGQHTLHALKISKKTIWLTLNLHKVNTKEDIEFLYSKYDIGRTRSLRDTMGSLGDDLGLNRRQLDVLGMATQFIQQGFKPKLKGEDPTKLFEFKDFELRKTAMVSWAEEAVAYFNCVDPAPTPNRVLFYRGAVAAVGLITLRYSKEKALTFWNTAALDELMLNVDPRRALITWLRNNNSAGRGQYLQHRAAISSWNSYYKGKINAKVRGDTDGVLQILGSPIILPAKSRT